MNRNQFLKTLGFSAASLALPTIGGAAQSEFILSPWQEYNRFFGGFKKGESIMITGPRKSGKSKLANQIFEKCVKLGLPASLTTCSDFIFQIDNSDIVIIDEISEKRRMQLVNYWPDKVVIFFSCSARGWFDAKHFSLKDGELTCLSNRNGSNKFKLKL